MTYDISLFAVTRFEWDAETMKLTMEGEPMEGVEYLFYWEGAVSSDGSKMTGTCNIITLYTDEYMIKHPSDPNFPTNIATELRGTFTAERQY